MAKDTRLDDLITQVKSIKEGNITEDSLYDLILSGYKCFKQGMGLPVESVKESIKKGLE